METVYVDGGRTQGWGEGDSRATGGKPASGRAQIRLAAKSHLSALRRRGNESDQPARMDARRRRGADPREKVDAKLMSPLRRGNPSLREFLLRIDFVPRSARSARPITLLSLSLLPLSPSRFSPANPVGCSCATCNVRFIAPARRYVPSERARRQLLIRCIRIGASRRCTRWVRRIESNRCESHYPPKSCIRRRSTSIDAVVGVIATSRNARH